MRWSESITLEFVKIYLKQECLWNPEHPGYKMRARRENAYAEIISEFSDSTSKTMNVQEVRLKIKHLRTTYNQQIQKILQSNPDYIYQPSLVWFHEMDRCLKHLPTNRHSTSSNNHIPDLDGDAIWLDHQSKSDGLDENPDPLVPEDTDYISENESILNRQRTPSPSYTKIKKKKSNHKSSVLYLSDSNRVSTREDEFEIYGKYIASQLRQMDLQKALRLQFQINNIVSRARLEDL